METQINPCGMSVEILHEGKIYFGHLYNDNTVDVESSLILFDENFDRIPFNHELYEILTPIIQRYIDEF